MKILLSRCILRKHGEYVLSDFINNMKKGLELHRAGKLDEAERFYSKALRFDPENGDLYNLVGLVAYEKGNDQKAVKMFRDAIARNKTRDDFYYNLGNALQASGDNESAVVAFRQSLMINPNNEKSWKNLGNVLELTGKREEALKAYQSSIKLYPMDAEVLFSAANILSEMGTYEEAAAFYRQTIELEPDHSKAFFNYGNICREKGRLDEALELYEKAVAADPQNADAYCNMGSVFKLQGKLEKAFLSYQHTVTINQKHVNALYNLGSLFQNSGNYEEALLFFERVIELDPSHASAGHLAASLKGDTTKTAPEKYLVDLFNEYSANFEKHLTEGLNYQVPFDLRKLLDSISTENRIFHNALDMGCGTGLSGEAFRSLSEKLTGIDISKKMIDTAETKKIYDNLINDNIIKFLSSTDEKYDLFIATDVFIYVGFLEDIFSAVKKVSADGAHLVFSVEKSEDENCVLRPTGRYAQSLIYIRQLAEANGFIIEKMAETDIRKAKDTMIPGYLFILKTKP